ncbi:hypothetical protein AX774_g4413 [Zancudomyces culisetae]|uniref:Uncharacterized protein n=1 Tax=Zancudomyces culisetae TaxID=1213189 RepID=A0A1R1PMD9_ZANCU|nr:hypothetical protein AX774_g4413 [Zancudomyces culisetae]|eukprot:OMH82116.1 hypothetical protein AX774_g4413 [Zancudomyces culisetae]
MGRVKNRGLHIIHGEDVARAIIEGLYKYPTPGQRWIVSEPECYDMLQIFSHYMDQPSLEILKKIIEDPSNKQYIPESSLDEIKNGKYKNNIQRRVDPDEFWKTFGLTPLHSFRFDSKYQTTFELSRV